MRPEWESAAPYALKIKDSIVNLHSDNDNGIYLPDRPLIISGGSVVAASIGNNSEWAFRCHDGITLEDGLTLSEPEGGTIDSINIKNPDGTVATRAVIGNGHFVTATANPPAGGTVTGTDVYTYNATATLTATPAEGYRFVNWTEDNDEVSTDTTYSFTVTKGRDLVANFERVYTIKFINEDGTELQSSTVAYGETPAYTGANPTKEASAQYTYNFLAWTPSIVPVTTDAVYKATYSSTVNEYTIKFINEDETELQSSSVAYGETPVYSGETPTKEATEQYTYTFAGWSPEITSVTGDATYTATYTQAPIEYTIKFTNDDGTELQSSSVAYGETPVYTGETPTKPDDDQYTYTFAGWSPEITSVTGDATYTATYSAEDNTEHSKSENDDDDISQITSDDEETPKSDDSEAKESGISNATSTGDQLNVLSWFALLTFSLICLSFIYLRKRIKKA